jgi:hypothetical protein
MLRVFLAFVALQLAVAVALLAPLFAPPLLREALRLLAP